MPVAAAPEDAARVRWAGGDMRARAVRRDVFRWYSVRRYRDAREA